MSDNYEHDKPYSLTGIYLENPSPSELTAPYDLHATYDVNLVANYLKAIINTGFIAEISGYNLQPVDNPGYLEAVINCSFLTDIAGRQDMNNLIGVSNGVASSFQKSQQKQFKIDAPYAKSNLEIYKCAAIYEQAKTLANNIVIGFEKIVTLTNAVRAVFEKSTGLKSSVEFVWQETYKHFKANNLVFETANKLRIDNTIVWQDVIRLRKNITYAHEVAHIFEKRFNYAFDKSLELITKHHFAWDKAKAIHYVKHKVKPWDKPILPDFTGSTDLNFDCYCNEVDAHNVILNFGADDCLPKYEDKKWWYIVNHVKVTRLDTDTEINVLSGSYSSDRGSWCWSYSLVVPPKELVKLEPINDEPIILKIEVNGTTHLMFYEGEPETNKEFAKTTHTLNGRSITALLSGDKYAPLRSYIQDNEWTSVQLIQAEIDRINSDIELDWQVLNENGWIVPEGNFSYVNLSPIDAIKQVAEAGGAFVYSDKGTKTLSIKPKYKKSYWDPLTLDDYDQIIPESFVLKHKIKESHEQRFNNAVLINSKTGDSYQIRLTGTAGDIPVESFSSPLLDELSAGWCGKSLLARAGKIEDHELITPINQEIKESTPGDLVAFNGEWSGIVDAVSVSFSHAYVTQQVTIERVINE